MLDGLLSPLRIPERAMDILARVAEDLSALRGEIAGGVSRLEDTTGSLASDMRLLLRDVAVVRDSTSRLPEGTARLEKAVDGMGAKLDHLHEGVGTLHGDMRELCGHVDQLGQQLAAMHEVITGMKGSVEEVTKDLPGSSGTGPIARMRDVIGGPST